MNKKIRKFIIIMDILIILILSILPFRLTGIEGLLNGTDAEFPICPIKDTIEFSQTWVPRYALGMDNLNRWLLPQIPYFLILSLMNLVGLSLGLINRMVLIACMFFLAFGVYCLIKYLTKNRISALVGAVFIIYNPMMHIPFRDLYINIFISYASYPFLVLFILKGLHKPESNFCYIWAIGVISLFWINAPVMIFTFFLCMAIFLIFYFIFNYRTLQEAIRGFKFIIKVVLVVIVINAWWILPFLLRSQALYYPYKLEAQMGQLDSGLSLLNLLSFYYIGNNVSNSLFGIFLMLLVLCSAFAINKNRQIIPWLILFLLSAFLRKGTHAPLGHIYKWLYLNVPGFGILRSSGHFGYFMFLSTTVLIGYSFSLFSQRSCRLKVWGFIITLYIIYGLFWHNKIIISGNLDGRWTPNKIPKHYEEYAKWLASQTDYFRIVIPRVVWYVDYTWAAWGFPLIEKFISSKPIVDQFTGSGWYNSNSEKIIEKILESIWQTPHKYLAKMLGLVSCKYIIAHRDTKLEHFPTWTLDMNVNKDMLLRCKGVKYIKSFGDVDICEIDEGYILPHIFISDSLVYAKNGIDKLDILSYGNYLGKNNVFYFDEADQDLNNKMESISNIFIYDNLNKEEDNDAKEGIYLVKNIGQDIKNGYFYADYNGDYLFRMRLLPQYVYVPDFNGVYWSRKFSNKHEQDEWIMSPCNITYSTVSQEESLIVKTYFDGNDREDEYLQIKKSGLAVDIKEVPYFNIEYKVENSSVQTIEIVFHLDFDNNGSVDGAIVGLYPKPAQTEFSNYLLDIYEIAKERFPEKENYIIRELEIYPHKIWWTDCSSDRKGEYKFWIKEVIFYEKTDGIKSINNLLVLKKEEIKNKEGLIPYTVNLSEIPFMEADVSIKGEPAFVQFLLNLDLNSDSKPDTDYFIEYRIYPESNQFRDLWRLNLLEKIEQDFPNANSYNLVQLKIVLVSNVIVKEIELFNYRDIRLNELNYKGAIFAVDGFIYNMICKNANKKESGLVFTRKLNLKKGIHTFSNYLRDGDSFAWDWLLIEPIKIDTFDYSKVEYKKMNNTRYYVKLNTKIKFPFWLIFNESYSNDWRAYMYKDTRYKIQDTKQSWSALLQMWLDKGNRIELKEHCKVNGFANGWHLTKFKTQNEKGKTEEINIVIEYIPQRWLELGILISLLGIVVILKRKYFTMLFKGMIVLEENILKKFNMEL